MTKTKTQKLRFRAKKQSSAVNTPRSVNAKPVIVYRDRKPPIADKSTGAFKRAGGAIGSLAGSVFGSSSVGRMVGERAGDIISRITGFGDYVVHSNSITSSATVPTFVNDGSGMRICHREYLADIVGSGGFTTTGFRLNPGLVSTFPWLSKIAANFDEYEMKGLVFEYRPTSGSISTASPALGSVMFATQYDSYDAQFHTKQQMDAYQFSNSCAPFEKMLHAVECAPNEKVNHKAYVRTTAVTTGSLLDYDLGHFYYATQGMPSQYVCGELWVTYDVVLSKPNLQHAYAPYLLAVDQSRTMTATNLLYDASASSSIFDFINSDGLVTGTSRTLLIGGSGALWANQMFGINVGTVPGNTLRIYQRGTYIIDYMITGTNALAVPTVTVSPTVLDVYLTTGTNMSATSTGAPGNVSYFGAPTALSVTAFRRHIIVIVTASSDTVANDLALVLPAGVAVGVAGGVQVGFRVMPIPSVYANAFF